MECNPGRNIRLIGLSSSGLERNESREAWDHAALQERFFWLAATLWPPTREITLSREWALTTTSRRWYPSHEDSTRLPQIGDTSKDPRSDRWLQSSRRSGHTAYPAQTRPKKSIREYPCQYHQPPNARSGLSSAKSPSNCRSILHEIIFRCKSKDLSGSQIMGSPASDCWSIERQFYLLLGRYPRGVSACTGVKSSGTLDCILGKAN